MFNPTLPRLLTPCLLTLTAACGAVDQMAGDDTGDDAAGDDGGDDTGDDAPDAAPPPPPPDSGPTPECTSDAQCPAEQPVCDDQSCRGCVLDSECPSGACDYATGACLDESQVLYVEPLGTGPCTRDAPCGWLQDAIPRVTANKHDILIAPATYTSRVTIGAATAPFTVHGFGAQLSSGGPTSGGSGAFPNATVRIDGAVTASFHGLRITADTTGPGTPNVAIACTGTALLLDQVELVGTGVGSGGGYIFAPCELTGTRLTIRAAGAGLEVWAANLTLDASRILGSGKEGLVLSGAAFDVTNTVIARSVRAGVAVYGVGWLNYGPQRLAFNTSSTTAARSRTTAPTSSAPRGARRSCATTW